MLSSSVTLFSLIFLINNLLIFMANSIRDLFFFFYQIFKFKYSFLMIAENYSYISLYAFAHFLHLFLSRAITLPRLRVLNTSNMSKIHEEHLDALRYSVRKLFYSGRAGKIRIICVQVVR